MARRTPSSSWPGRSRSRPRPVPMARKIASCSSTRSVERGVDADAEPGAGFDAELEDGLHLAGDERARQAVLGDAEDHHPAEPVLGLVDGDGMTGEAEVVGGREARGPAADDADRRAGGGGHGAVRLVPNGAGGEALDAEALGHEPLEGADGDRRVDGPPPARGLAGRRAHSTADRRERVRRPRDQVRVAVAALGDRGDVAAGVGVHGARGAARLVLPQPLRVGHTGCRRHQTTPCAWSRRSAHASAKSRAKKPVVMIVTRPCRSTPVRFSRSQFGR